ncbi:MAG: hypothetical protein IJ131_01375 [Eggerthellaceae bacterium]|nr:hypothetical protein [Eggerthellaceae bacterium]
MIELKAYEGLIRNYRDLAAELGVDIANCTRREREERIVLAAWERWGEHLGAHVNGQFAIALQDSDTGELFCTRDVLGVELLYYYETSDGRLLFATQIKDLFDQPGFVRELNRDMVQFFLGFTYVPGEETLFAGVHKLEPGGWLRYGASGLLLGRYWELTFEPDDQMTEEQWADQIDAALEASLADLCDEGEEYDSFLSGGVDSSYLMAKSRSRRGYCVAYEDQGVGEQKEASETAEYLGRDFESVFVSAQDFFGSLDEFLLAYEQPQADVAGLSLFAGCKKLAGKASIVLSGEGADEFFAGYSVYARVGRVNMGFSPVYMGATYIMNPSEQKRYLSRFDSKVSARRFMRNRGLPGRVYDPLTWMLYTETRSFFEGSILFNSNRIASGTGLDIRMPFCDLRIFDIARRMPSRYKANKDANKIALRRAAGRVLPHEVAYRKKLGFPVPVRTWLTDSRFNGDIRRAFEGKTAHEFFNVDEIGALLDVFLGEEPRVSHPVWFARHKALLWRHVWTIYVFIRWYELFFEQHDPMA